MVGGSPLAGGLGLPRPARRLAAAWSRLRTNFTATVTKAGGGDGQLIVGHIDAGTNDLGRSPSKAISATSTAAAAAPWSPRSNRSPSIRSAASARPAQSAISSPTSRATSAPSSSKRDHDPDLLPRRGRSRLGVHRRLAHRRATPMSMPAKSTPPATSARSPSSTTSAAATAPTAARSARA